MMRLADGITIYELKRGKITPRDEFAIALEEARKNFSRPSFLPNADVYFLQQYKLTILYASPARSKKDVIY